MLAVYSLEARSYVQDDVNLLRSAGNVLAAAIARARTEDEVREANSLLHGVVEGSADAVFVKDTEGRYLLINSAGARVMGRMREDVVGRTAADIFGEEAAEALERHDREVIAEREALQFEESVRVDGAERVFLAAKSPYFDAQGRVAGSWASRATSPSASRPSSGSASWRRRVPCSTRRWTRHAPFRRSPTWRSPALPICA